MRAPPGKADDRFSSIVCLANVESDRYQHLRHKLARLGLVVDHQHPTRICGRFDPDHPSRRRFEVRSIRFTLAERYLNVETTAPAHLACDRDIAAQKARELPADRQPQAGAPGACPGGSLLEGIEDPLAVHDRDSRSTVLYIDEKPRGERVGVLHPRTPQHVPLLGELDGVAQ